MEEIEKKYGFIFLKDVDEDKIIDLFNHDMIEKIDDNKYWNYVGLYYWKKIKNYDSMHKFFLMAIDRDNDLAMFNLGYYYETIEKNYDLMKKYYLMVDVGIILLGTYYRQNKLSRDDIINIIKYKIEHTNLNIKIILENKFIFDYYQYLMEHNNVVIHHPLIKLVYCD
jgi:hypothetical protein